MHNIEKKMDYQKWPDTGCLHGGVVKSMELVKKKTNNKIQLGIININHTYKLQPEFFCNKDKKWFHVKDDIRVVQVTYRVNCGYGHYLMLIIKNGDAYLFDSGDCVHLMNYSHILQTILNDYQVNYKGNVYHQLVPPRVQENINTSCEDCSIWIALIYYILADPKKSNTNQARWTRLTKFLNSSHKVKQDEFNRLLHILNDDVPKSTKSNSSKKDKKNTVKKTTQDCPDGKIYNEKTKRCNKIKKLKDDCPDGKIYNEKTKRCNNVKKTKT